MVHSYYLLFLLDTHKNLVDKRKFNDSLNVKCLLVVTRNKNRMIHFDGSFRYTYKISPIFPEFI